jgi:hypothetical protein
MDLRFLFIEKCQQPPARPGKLNQDNRHCASNKSTTIGGERSAVPTLAGALGFHTLPT